MAYLLEVCADSVKSAVEAQTGGADRIELCSALVIGGLSPSAAMFEQVKKNVDLPIRVLLRPRFGDFCYIQCSLCFFAGISGFDSWNMDLYFSGISCPESDGYEKAVCSRLSL